MSFSKMVLYQCDICNYSQTTSGPMPVNWAEWKLKCLNGLAYEKGFHTCSACLKAEKNLNGDAVAYDVCGVFKRWLGKGKERPKSERSEAAASDERSEDETP